MQGNHNSTVNPSLWKGLPFFVKFFSFYYVILVAAILVTIPFQDPQLDRYYFVANLYGVVLGPFTKGLGLIALGLYLYKVVVAYALYTSKRSAS